MIPLLLSLVIHGLIETMHTMMWPKSSIQTPMFFRLHFVLSLSLIKLNTTECKFYIYISFFIWSLFHSFTSVLPIVLSIYLLCVWYIFEFRYFTDNFNGFAGPPTDLCLKCKNEYSALQRYLFENGSPLWMNKIFPGLQYYHIAGKTLIEKYKCNVFKNQKPAAYISCVSKVSFYNDNDNNNDDNNNNDVYDYEYEDKPFIRFCVKNSNNSHPFYTFSGSVVPPLPLTDYLTKPAITIKKVQYVNELADPSSKFYINTFTKKYHSIITSALGPMNEIINHDNKNNQVLPHHLKHGPGPWTLESLFCLMSLTVQNLNFNSSDYFEPTKDQDKDGKNQNQNLTRSEQRARITQQKLDADEEKKLFAFITNRKSSSQSDKKEYILLHLLKEKEKENELFFQTIF
jgi:hypothetical protein